MTDKTVRMRHLLATLFVALAFGAWVDQAAAQDQPTVKVKVVIGNRVYHPSTLKRGAVVSKIKPAVFSSAKALAATHEYKKIRDDGLKPGSAERHLLEVAASKKLRNAISRVVSLHGYDLVAETGAVTVAGKALPDITSEIITNLR